MPELKRITVDPLVTAGKSCLRGLRLAAADGGQPGCQAGKVAEEAIPDVDSVFVMRHDELQMVGVGE